MKNQDKLCTSSLPGEGADAFNFESMIASAPSLFILQRDQHSGRFNVNLAMAEHKFILRLTGGCGNMKPEYWDGMENVINALCGRITSGKRNPFAGLGLSGGTRMLYKSDTRIVRPGVTEIFPASMDDCPKARFMGVVGQVDKKLRYLPWLIVSEEKGSEFFTIIHPQQHSCALLTENPDEPSKSPWVREYTHCFDICSELIQGGWQALLMAYNGGGVTGSEVDLWAKAGIDDPAWRVLLVDGSGGTAEARAQDTAWRAQHPTVHSAANDTDDIWTKLVELGALSE